MRLLLDEDSGSKDLLRLLKADSHDVERVIDVPALGMAAPDHLVFAYAVKHKRSIITKNAADHIAIANMLTIQHYGILCLYYLEEGQGLSVTMVAKAVQNIANTYPSCQNLILSINEHQW